MSSVTIGAESVQKQDFSCIIHKIVCHYTSDDAAMEAVLYDHDDPKHASLAGKGIVYGGISNMKDFEYYFITNHKGKNIELECDREVNLCTDEKHQQYVIDYVDIDSGELKAESRDINDRKLKLFYFNLFYRAGEYAKASAKSQIMRGWESGGLSGAIKQLPIGAAAGVAGAFAGSVKDYIWALRFILLPRIKPNDTQYECHTSLTYRECPHKPSVPLLTINTYPDIEFSLEIGFSGKSHEYYADSGEKDKVADTPFSFELSAKYASIEKKLSFEHINEKELDAESQQGTRFYKSIKTLADFLKGAAHFAQTLSEIIPAAYGKNDHDLKKDIAKVGQISDNAGSALQSSSGWLKGSLEIKPSLSGKWRYSVSDDLSRIGRYIELGLGAECKGELTVDLIQVYILFLKKTETATTAAAVTTSVASGGLAGIPALLIKFLVDTVVHWLIEKFKKGVKFELVFSCEINLKPMSFNWDTSRSDQILQGNVLTLEIEPEIKLVAALEYKSSWILKLTVEAEISAATSLTWEMKFNVKNGWLGVDNDVSINPFKLAIECTIAGAYEIDKSSKSPKSSRKGDWSNEWSVKEYKMSSKRCDWIKLYDVSSSGDGQEIGK